MQKGNRETEGAEAAPPGSVEMARTAIVANVRKLVLGGIATALLVAITVTCAILFVTAVTVRITNTSNQTLTDIRCTLSADGATWTEVVDQLKPGEDVQFTRSTSDLYVLSVEYRFHGELRQWRQGSIATTGETLRLEISRQGDVLVSYDR